MALYCLFVRMRMPRPRLAHHLQRQGVHVAVCTNNQAERIIRWFTTAAGVAFDSILRSIPIVDCHRPPILKGRGGIIQDAWHGAGVRKNGRLLALGARFALTDPRQILLVDDDDHGHDRGERSNTEFWHRAGGWTLLVPASDKRLRAPFSAPRPPATAYRHTPFAQWARALSAQGGLAYFEQLASPDVSTVFGAPWQEILRSLVSASPSDDDAIDAVVPMHVEEEDEEEDYWLEGQELGHIDCRTVVVT